MQNEESHMNTPETLGVTPRYALQYNAISRSAHSMSATAKKLAIMATALLPLDQPNTTVSFTFTDFCNAIGYGDGGKEYQLFTAAVEECMKAIISIETGKTIKGKTSWEKFAWFEYAKFNAVTGVCTMRFSNELAYFLKEMKKVYAKINLSDVGQLQSKYALRIFEMAKSYESLAGKDGNESDTWYFERSVQEFRTMFGVPEEAYQETKRFRQKVIEEPIKEINNAGIGMELTTEGVKQGRKLKAIRINCKTAPRKTTTKKGRKKKSEGAVQLELPGLSSKNADSKQDKELEHLKELYPAEFAELYEAELSKGRSYASDEIKQMAAEGSALMQLKERHGIVK